MHDSLTFDVFVVSFVRHHVVPYLLQ